MITVVHETGHALAALTTFSRLNGIRINGDHSGDTRFLATGFLPFRVWATWWGYPFPAFTGLAGLWAAYHGWSGAALTVAALVAVIISLEIRSLVAFATIGATTVGILAAWWWLPAVYLTPLVYFVSYFFLFGAARGFLNLVRAHLEGETEHSDASLLAQATFIIPAPVWLTTFGVAIGWVFYQVWVLVGGLYL